MHVERETVERWGPIIFTLLAGLLVIAGLDYASRLAPSSEPAARAPATPTAAATAPRDVPTPKPDQLHSRFVGQAAPAPIRVGETASVRLQFRNAGSVAWVKGTAAEIRLGVVGEDGRFADAGMAVDWPLPTRPAVQQEAVVEPNGTVTFEFKVKGTSAGVHRIPVRPVVDGVAWLEDDGVAVTLTVR